MIINRVKKLKRSHPAFIDTLLSKLRSKLIISSLDGGNKNYEELFSGAVGMMKYCHFAKFIATIIITTCSARSLR